MLIEVLRTQGSRPVARRCAGVCSIGEALAELISRYDLALESEGGELDCSHGQAEFVFANCEPIGCAAS